MSGPEPEWLLAAWVRLVQTRWLATGVSRADRSNLLRQLLSDLAAARAGGASVDELVATPPAAFADSCAAGLRSRTAPINLAPLLGVCLGTGVVAAGMAWIVLNLIVRAMSDMAILDQVAFSLGIDLLLAAMVLAAMVVAVRWVFRRQQEAVTLAPRLAVTLTSGAVFGFPLASAYGASQAYSVKPDVVGVEVLIVLTALAIATVVAQRWTRPRRRLGQTEATS